MPTTTSGSLCDLWLEALPNYPRGYLPKSLQLPTSLRRCLSGPLAGRCAQRCDQRSLELMPRPRAALSSLLSFPSAPPTVVRGHRHETQPALSRTRGGGPGEIFGQGLRTHDLRLFSDDRKPPPYPGSPAAHLGLPPVGYGPACGLRARCLDSNGWTLKMFSKPGQRLPSAPASINSLRMASSTEDGFGENY